MFEFLCAKGFGKGGEHFFCVARGDCIKGENNTWTAKRRDFTSKKLYHTCYYNVIKKMKQKGNNQRKCIH